MKPELKGQARSDARKKLELKYDKFGTPYAVKPRKLAVIFDLMHQKYVDMEKRKRNEKL